jgi:hypothetical protein
MTWVQTHSGRAVDLLHPDPATILIEDVAIALSRICRYTGHVPLSVAQHSVLCAEQAPPALAYEALMHDAHEAFMGDIASPIKAVIRAVFREQVPCRAIADPIQRLDRALRRAVAEAFGLEPDEPEGIREIDLRMCQTERLQGFQHKLEWQPSIEAQESYPIVIEPWDEILAKCRFLDLYYQLRPAVH